MQYGKCISRKRQRDAVAPSRRGTAARYHAVAVALRRYMANQPFHATFTILFYFEEYIYF